VKLYKEGRVDNYYFARGKILLNNNKELYHMLTGLLVISPPLYGLIQTCVQTLSWCFVVIAEFGKVFLARLREGLVARLPAYNRTPGQRAVKKISLVKAELKLP